MLPLARAGRNVLLKSAGEFLARLSYLALFILAARLLGAADYGLYNYSASLSGLFLIGMNMGLDTLLVREVARRPGDLGQWTGTLLLARCLLALLIMAGVAAWTLLAGPGQPRALLLAVTAAQIPLSLAGLGAAALSAVERMDQEAMVKTISRLVALLSGGALLLAGGGVWGLVAGVALSNLAAMVGHLGLVWRRASFSLNLSRDFLVKVVSRGLPLALSLMFSSLYSNLDVVMLGAMGRPYAEIGWYTAAARVLNVLAVPAVLVAAGLLPVLSSLAGRQPVAMAQLHNQGLRLLLILGLPATVGLWVVRGPVALLAFGPEFGPTGQAFAVLAPTLVMIYVNYLNLTVLNAMGRQALGAAATAGGLAVNLLLNVFLIPRHGFLGAAAATLCTEAVLFLVCFWLVRRAAGITWPWPRLWRPVLATALMGLALWLGRELDLWAMMALGVMVYVPAALACRVVTPQEWRDLVAALRPRDMAGEGPEA